MEKTIITVGDANSSGGKVITGSVAHTSMGKDALQLEPPPPWIAIPMVDMSSSDFLYLYVFHDKPQHPRLQATLRAS